VTETPGVPEEPGTETEEETGGDGEETGSETSEESESATV
jgi:hypothetical protein